MSDNYYHTKDSVDEYIRLAEDANGAHLLEKLKIFLKPNSLLLEIGSAPGSDLQILKRDYRMGRSDFSMKFLNRLIRNSANDDFLELDAITLKTDKKF